MRRIREVAGAHARVQALDRVYRRALARDLCDAHLGNVALWTDQDTAVTYDELAHTSARIASGLFHRHGVTKGTRVGVMLGEGKHLYACTIALARLGAVCMPLTEAMLPYADPCVVVTEAHYPELAGTQGPDPPAPTLHTDDILAIHYYKSESGTVRGVQVPVKALGHIHLYMEYGAEVVEGDVFYTAAPLTSAYGLYYGVYGALLRGSQVAMVPMHRVTNAVGTCPSQISATALRRGAVLTPHPLDTGLNQHFGQPETGVSILDYNYEPMNRMGRKPMLGLDLRLGSTLTKHGTGALTLSTQAPMFWFKRYTDTATPHRFDRTQFYYHTGARVTLSSRGVVSALSTMPDGLH